MNLTWADPPDASTFDELLQPDGSPRPGCADVLARLRAIGTGLHERQAAAEAAIQSLGITFTLYTENGSIDRNWPLDVIPRIIRASEWDGVTAGLIQRLAALNAFIDDLYHDQHILNDGTIPRELITGSANYRPECEGVSPKHGVWAHISGSDLVRDETGKFLVLEDNLRVPSGVSYMLENRNVAKRVFSELFRDLDILPVDAYTDRLGQQMRSLSPRDGIEPVVAVLTPGIFNSAYYEHVLLADRMGAALVEGSDLVVENDVVYMRTISGLVRVDVIYRRVDDLFLDPAEFHPGSVLGPAGLMAAWRAGNVAIANAPGAGVADDKVLYSYVPEIIRYYLDEDPLIANVETWRCLEPSHLSHVLANLETLVCKPANESGGKGVTIGSLSSAAELDDLRRQILDDPRNWVAQPILSLSTTPTICGDVIAPRHVDLRPFILSGVDPYVSVGGLTRVALREGTLIVNSSQGGGSKDTWIVDDSVQSQSQSQSQNGQTQSQNGQTQTQNGQTQTQSSTSSAGDLADDAPTNKS